MAGERVEGWRSLPLASQGIDPFTSGTDADMSSAAPTRACSDTYTPRPQDSRDKNRNRAQRQKWDGQQQPVWGAALGHTVQDIQLTASVSGGGIIEEVRGGGD